MIVNTFFDYLLLGIAGMSNSLPILIALCSILSDLYLLRDFVDCCLKRG